MEYISDDTIGDLIRPPSLGRQLNFAAGACMAMCNAMLGAHNLTLPQWVVLGALWQKDHLTVGEIAGYSGNNIPATSRILDRMVEKDLLHRVDDPLDKRSVRIVLCPAGEALRHLNGLHAQMNATLLNGLSKEDAMRLSALLTHVEANARGWTPL